MHKPKRRVIATVVGAAALLLLACWFGIGRLRAGERTETAIVATVDGAAIARSDIQPSQKAIDTRFTQVHGRDPGADVDAELVKNITHELEEAALVKQIRAVVRKTQMNRLGVAVSADEIDERWRRATDGVDVDTKLGEWNATLSILIDSLQYACVAAADTDAIYAQRLEGRMPKAQWDMHVKHDCAPERRRILAAYSSKGGARRDEYPEILEGAIATEKARAAIDRELVESDPEYAEYMTLLKTDPGVERVQAKPPGFRDSKHQQWWETRYREAKVQINDAQFKDAWPPNTQR